MKEQSITISLNELIGVFLHNFIYYIPSDIIFNGVLDQLENELPDNFFDELSLLDLYKGIYQIENSDGIEINNKLIEKRLSLENNIFILSEKHKELSAVEFQILIEKYYEQILFYLFLSDWLITNLKKYNEDDLHISIIGAYKLQYEYLSTHLNGFYTYFGSFIDIKKELNFSTKKLVTEHFPDLISRYIQSTKVSSKNTCETITEIENKEGDKKIQHPQKKTSPKKKQRPNISDIEIEELILKNVFKVKQE